MKIGISCSKFGVSGGMERYAYELIYGLNKLNITPTVITRKIDNNLPGLDGFEVLKVNMNFIPGKLRDLFFSWKINHYKKSKNIDLLIACSRIASPDIMICGGTHIGFMNAMHKKAKLSDKLQIWLERKQCENSKFIIAHSQLMKDELIQFYQVEPSKIQLIYPPIDDAKFKPISNETRIMLREKFGFKSDKFYFLFPSGSHNRKGLPFLQKFFMETKLPIELVVLGKPVTGINIKTLPWNKEIEELYQAADATILASQYEPFGLVGVESVLCGTPIVFANNIGSCEVIDSPAKQCFIPQDYASLKLAIKNIIEFDRLNNSDFSKFIKYDTKIQSHIQRILKLINYTK